MQRKWVGLGCSAYTRKMTSRVLIRFVPPAPVLGRPGAGVPRTWDINKLTSFLQEELEIWTADLYPSVDIQVVESRQAEIRFDGWKPDKAEAARLRQAIGEQMAVILEGIEPDDYLSP